MSDSKLKASKVTMRNLWREFLPLSLSDVVMACGDPLITTSLAHLPDSRANISAVGVAKSLAIFFESPIIMILHASNTLAGRRASRKALWHFTLLCCGILTFLLTFLSIPTVFAWIGIYFFDLKTELMERARIVLTLLIFWPAAIGWRRYFQGLLIHSGHSKTVGNASIARLVVVIGILIIGFRLKGRGEVIAGMALLGGIFIEAIYVTLAARRLGVVTSYFDDRDQDRPNTIGGVLRFYWPLANSMMVVWGGRAILVAIIARSFDASLALAAWPAAWGIVLVIANATRMVQQVVIRNRNNASFQLLMVFAASVGLLCTFLLLTISITPIGNSILETFVGSDQQLLIGVKPVILLCSVIPLFIAIQNAMQGFLIGEGKTTQVNTASMLGSIFLLIVSLCTVNANLPGANSAAIAMLCALFIETLWLTKGLRGLYTTRKSDLLKIRQEEIHRKAVS